MRGEEKRALILNGNMYKVILVLAVPIMLNNFMQTLFGIVDAYFVNKLGYVEFAATSFVWPVNFLFISLGIGISIAGTSILSQLVGASRYEEANKYASQLIMVSVVASTIFTAVGYVISPLIVRLMGATADMAAYSTTYLRITFLGTPFMFFYFNFNSIMNAQGDTIKPTILSAGSVILNIILDPILIFTLKMGVAGAAMATLIPRTLSAALGLYLLAKHSPSIKPSLKGFKFDLDIIKHLVRVGLPSAIGQSGSALGFMVLNTFIVSYGTVTMASFSMVNRITSLVMQPAMGFGAALTAIVGQNLGNNQVERVKEGFKKAIQLSMIISVAGCIGMLVWDSEIIHFFMDSKGGQEVITQGVTYLQYIAYSMPLMAIFSILQGVFQGSGHTKYSMAMEIGRLWFVRLPMILIFKHFTSVGSVGIWFSMSFSNLIVCLFGYAIYRAGNWQTKIIRQEAKESAA